MYTDKERGASHGRAMVVLALIQTIIDESMHIITADDVDEIAAELETAIERYRP